MDEETRRALESAIISAHLRLAYKIIKVAVRDAKHYSVEAKRFLFSEGFLWLLQLIGCEPENLEDIAGRIALQAFGLE